MALAAPSLDPSQLPSTHGNAQETLRERQQLRHGLASSRLNLRDALAKPLAASDSTTSIPTWVV